MKKAPVKMSLASRCRVGALLLALCAFTSTSHAAVILNNLPDAGGAGTYPTTTTTAPGTLSLAQTFTMSGSTLNLSSVTLSLVFTAADSASVYLYDTSGGAPTGSGTLLGIVSSAGAASGNFTIGSLNNTLNASTTYAIALGSAGNGNNDIQWDVTSTSGSEGTGASLGGRYLYTGSSWSSGGANYFQMELAPVPEVPVTGLFMGFGALAIALGHTLRRKFRAIASKIG